MHVHTKLQQWTCCMHILILYHFEDSGMMRCSMILMKYGTLSIELELTQWKLHTWGSQLHIVSTMFILIEHKHKKKFQIWFVHRVKTIPRSEFLPLVRYCIVIKQIAQLCTIMNTCYRWHPTCAPDPNHHEGSLRKALWQPWSVNYNHGPKALLLDLAWFHYN